MRQWSAGLAVVVMAVTAHPAHASGHGPVFGAATPTLGKGGWAFDQAWMAQVTSGPTDTAALLRSMISFGVTEKVQVSGSLPVPIGDTHAMPAGRMTAMMSGNPDVEALLGWRFQTRPVGNGARLESTVYIGGLVPLDRQRGGVETSPAGLVSATSGYASRSHYFWAGATHIQHANRDGDRLGAVTSLSLVYGYRPPAWRKDYPRPDLRFFIEATGDITGASRHRGETMANTGGRVLMAGPTLLFLYKAYGVEGGVQFPVYQRNRELQPNERFRLGVNFTYFFWPSRPKGH